MPSDGWTDAVWEDPDGGSVILHGTMPTVVYPNAMRPRAAWHGLALLESPDVSTSGFRKKPMRRNRKVSI